MDTIYGTEQDGRVLLENTHAGAMIWIRTIAPKHPALRGAGDVSLPADEARALAYDLLKCADEADDAERQADRHSNGEPCEWCSDEYSPRQDRGCPFYDGDEDAWGLVDDEDDA